MVRIFSGKAEAEHAQYGGLVEALAQPNAAAMEVEVVGQDVEAVTALERDLNEESIMVRFDSSLVPRCIHIRVFTFQTRIQLIRSLLGQQMAKGKLDEVHYKGWS